jgi:23S rRNA U2552 (ribose-2'-O)-methylase RlmE/FtsJ
MLEIGIGYKQLMDPFVPFYVHGASLWMWQDYLPQAEIFACDILPQTLINEERIRSFVCDQSDPKSLKTLVKDTGGNFDFVVDDGSHAPEHQILSAEILLPHVNSGGVYVIEDVQDPDKVSEATGGEIITFDGSKSWDDVLCVIEK